MLSSATTSIVQTVDESEHIIQRRIRHITEIQIRNLTPFPVRDAVTTALTQPAEQSQFPATGVVDDLGAILSRKHGRKASTSSTMARFNPKLEDSVPEQPNQRPPLESLERRASTSSSTMQSPGLKTSTSTVKGIHPSTSSRTTRSVRGHRPRTSSVTSFNSSLLTSSVLSAGESSAVPPVLTDNSQTSLERIINSRMVETFIVIKIPFTSTNGLEMLSSDISMASSPLRSVPISKSSSSSHIRGSKLGPITPSTVKQSPSTLSPQKFRTSQPKSAPPSKSTFPQHAILKVGYQSLSKINGFSAPPKSLSRSGKPIAEHPVEAQEIVLHELASPLYFSPIHRPSINPIFSLDTQSGHDFPPNCDTSGHFLKLEVWGKVPMRERVLVTNYQHLAEPSNDEEPSLWKLLDEKDIHLNELIPLPNDLETNPSQLPSNTVLITLSPPGQTFYLPHLQPSLISRPNTPTNGYASDPESEIRKAKQNSDQPSSEGGRTTPVSISPLSRRRRHQGLHDSTDLKGGTKTATWQDLFKLVNLQSLILDNESSLGEVIRKINSLLEEDQAIPLRREVSEREFRIRDMRTTHDLVLDQIAHRKMEAAERAEKLRIRSEVLKSARDALSLDAEMDRRTGDEMNQLTLIHGKVLSARTSLLFTLSTIFPIELYSPPDLLYNILDVLLPIPVNPSDPAPPLSMSAHKDVTEDGVATALGYVAQVLQILAAYVGKNLTYPVTCIGSRSLIRDDISAMVGPRMFPLFSKGVDTYRFEYGVFLLNKDIEMLMSERDLRALDMRHTLPNLKNLLLTLSHDNNSYHQPARSASLTSVSPTGLETPLRTPSPEIDDVQTPKPTHINLDIRSVSEGATTTPMASGTTTPTAPSVLEDSRKQKSFLGFVPFSDFLRSRYPSSGQATQAPSGADSEEGSAYEHSDVDSEESNEEDRMTIHAPASDGVPMNGSGGIVAET